MTLAQYSFFFFFFKIWYLAENERENIAFSKIPVIKGAYKPLFFTEYLVIMLFLSTGIFSKRQNMLYMVWRYTTEKLTIINAGLFRAHHLNYGSNIELKSGISQSILNRFSCNFPGYIGSYIFECPQNLIKFGQLFQKLLGNLDWPGRSPGVR